GTLESGGNAWRRCLSPSLLMNEIIVIGGGLAGVEAAWQAANAGARVRLYEMRPLKQTPAHRTDRLAEIVCSNSLKSDEPGTASNLLKEELRRGGSLVMEAAAATRVPAGATAKAATITSTALSIQINTQAFIRR